MATGVEHWSVRGRTVLVTGGTRGIGYHTARVLAGWGAQVLITGRDAATGRRAAAAIRQQAGHELVSFVPADHATVQGNRQLAHDIRAAVAGLDILINNVGGLYPTRRETSDGYEATLGMNFVGPFTLSSELLPLLQARAPARCINVVSAGFKMFTGDPFADPQSRHRFVSGDAYAHSKLLNVLVTLALAQRLPAEQVTVNLVHPGMAWTPMTRSMTAQTIPQFRAVWPLVRIVQRWRSPEKAGSRVAALVVSPVAGAATGQYFERSLRPKRLSARELDPQAQQRAWQLGQQLMAQAAERTS
jgi:NAD(P)-dependent dehydrogenase (short-subunit alcohol dehydrogenase family)